FAHEAFRMKHAVLWRYDTDDSYKLRLKSDTGNRLISCTRESIGWNNTCSYNFTTLCGRHLTVGNMTLNNSIVLNAGAVSQGIVVVPKVLPLGGRGLLPECECLSSVKTHRLSSSNPK